MLFVYISLSMATVRAEAPIFKNGESLLLSAPKVVLSIGFHKMKKPVYKKLDPIRPKN